MHGWHSGSFETPRHPCVELIRRFADTGSIGRADGTTLTCCAHPLEKVGVEIERQEKSVLSPAQRFTFLGVVWDFTTIQASLCTILLHV